MHCFRNGHSPIGPGPRMNLHVGKKGFTLWTRLLSRKGGLDAAHTSSAFSVSSRSQRGNQTYPLILATDQLKD